MCWRNGPLSHILRYQKEIVHVSASNGVVDNTTGSWIIVATTLSLKRRTDMTDSTILNLLWVCTYGEQASVDAFLNDNESKCWLIVLIVQRTRSYKLRQLVFADHFQLTITNAVSKLLKQFWLLHRMILRPNVTEILLFCPDKLHFVACIRATHWQATEPSRSLIPPFSIELQHGCAIQCTWRLMMQWMLPQNCPASSCRGKCRYRRSSHFWMGFWCSIGNHQFCSSSEVQFLQWLNDSLLR